MGLVAFWPKELFEGDLSRLYSGVDSFHTNNKQFKIILMKMFQGL